jgi:hypothetical protein
MIKNQTIDFHLISFSTMEFQNKTLLQFFFILDYLNRNLQEIFAKYPNPNTEKIEDPNQDLSL